MLGSRRRSTSTPTPSPVATGMLAEVLSAILGGVRPDGSSDAAVPLHDRP
jgi:hypothetical protein